MLGIDVGGQSRAEIVSAIGRWSAQRVTIHADGHSYHVPRGWLVAVDAQATAKRALAAGSWSTLVVERRTVVAPAMKRASVAGNVLSEIARAGRPAVSATVRVDGWRAVTTPARVGRRLDRAALLQRLRQTRPRRRRAVCADPSGGQHDRGPQRRREDRRTTHRPRRDRLPRRAPRGAYADAARTCIECAP